MITMNYGLCFIFSNTCLVIVVAGGGVNIVSCFDFKNKIALHIQQFIKTLL